MPIKINALPAGKLLMFDGVRRFLPSPFDSNRLLFQGSFIEYASIAGGRYAKDIRLECTVPLSFLSMFHTRSHWRDQLLLNQREIQKMLRFKNLKTHVSQIKQQIIYDFADTDGIHRKSHILPLTEAENLPIDAKLSWVGRLPIGQVKLNWDEFVRFYLGTFGIVFYDIIKCAQDGGNLTHICRPERTRLVDGTLYITPREHIRDRGSILQIGMLVADDELRQQVFRMARFVAGEAYGFKSTAFIPDFPKGTDRLYVQYADGKEDMKGASGSTSWFKSITKIRSDYREAKFDTIIAEITADRYAPLEKPSEEQEVQNLVRSFADGELSVSGKPLANKHSVTIPVAWQNFRDGFPNYREAKVQLSHIDPPIVVPIFLPRQLEKLIHHDFTENIKQGENGLPKLKRSSRIWTEPTPPQKDVLSQASLIEPAVPLLKGIDKLSARLRVFWDASLSLDGQGHSAGGLALCYQIPSSWGSFSSFRKGGARCFLYSSLSTELGEAYAIEFDKEDLGIPTSIGVVAKHDGSPMTVEEVFACVKSAVSHVSQRERHSKKYVRVQTIWPNTKIYTDVRSTSLRHYKDMSDVDLLANAILNATRALLACN
jgi:hypothetical protein